MAAFGLGRWRPAPLRLARLRLVAALGLGGLRLPACLWVKRQSVHRPLPKKRVMQLFKIRL
jgi:hypothetical protein